MVNKVTIEYDRTSEKVAILDVIRMVTGTSKKKALKTLTQLEEKLQISMEQLNDKGQKKPVGDLATCMELIHALKGKLPHARYLGEQTGMHIDKLASRYWFDSDAYHRKWQEGVRKRHGSTSSFS